MRNKTWRVTLTDAERTALRELIAAGEAPARKLTHARILLKADESSGGPGWSDGAITEALEGQRADGGTGAQAVRHGGTRCRVEPSAAQGPAATQARRAPGSPPDRAG